MAKRTIKVVDLVDMVNYKNAHSTCGPDVRRGWNAMLEDILHGNDAYAGFGYLTESEVPPGQLPGVCNTDTNPTFPDDTRRHYAKHRRLTQ